MSLIDRKDLQTRDAGLRNIWSKDWMRYPSFALDVCFMDPFSPYREQMGNVEYSVCL